MLGHPVNDAACLSKVTTAIEHATEQEPVRNLADRFGTTRELAAWIRTLPQRNDTGQLSDGPRITCDVSQRLRIPADDPNCVERAAIYMAASELIDPQPVRQLATISTPIGRHTFPVEDDRPVKLDPQIPRNALEAGLFRMNEPAHIELSPRETLEWISAIASEPARQYRNGAARLGNARQAFVRVLRGEPVPRNSFEDVGFALAVAEQAAQMFGVKGMEVVRIGTMAITHALKRQQAGQRNLRLNIGGIVLRPDLGKLGSLARVGGRIGLNIGSAVLRAKLESLGIGAPIISELERELGREGLTLGALAAPPPMPGTLAAVTTKALITRRIVNEVR